METSTPFLLGKIDSEKLGMNAKIARMTMPDRRELVRQIDEAHSRGIRLDPKLVSEARESLILQKPTTPEVSFDEPTKEQMDKMLRSFGLA